MSSSRLNLFNALLLILLAIILSWVSITNLLPHQYGWLNIKIHTQTDDSVGVYVTKTPEWEDNIAGLTIQSASLKKGWSEMSILHIPAGKHYIHVRVGNSWRLLKNVEFRQNQANEIIIDTVGREVEDFVAFVVEE